MNFKEYVNHKGIRVNEMAFIMGMPQSRISELLHDVRPVTLPIAMKLVALSGGEITYEDLAEAEIKRKSRRRSGKKMGKHAAQDKRERTKSK